ncbi:MAG: FadR family transcriptional regulator [Rhodoferax sp.]|nr:FadR family transcriptional regulator [Actinomycetota bacterium]
MTPGGAATTARSGEGLKAFEVVLRWVDDRILGGQLAVGDQLPAERELARMLDVSRAAVREAVRTLQAQGIVRSSVGGGGAGGTTITGGSTNALSLLLRRHVALSIFPAPDVVEVRVSLERLSVRLAAANATPEHLAPMRALLDVMADPGIDRSQFNDCDTAFHVAMADAAGNLLVRDLTAAIRESLRLPILDRFHALQSWSEVAETLRGDHQSIFAAVARGDGEAAAALVEDHIRSAWRILEGAVQR